MKLLTKEILKRIPKEIPENDNPFVYVKFFTPYSNWTWYAVSYNPDEELFFGLVFGIEQEWGYFGLKELEDITGPYGLKVERDKYFKPCFANEIKGKKV